MKPQLDQTRMNLPWREALRTMQEPIHPVSAEVIDISLAAGRTLAQDIAADGDMPPWNNSAMDGYAVRFEDTLEASEQIPRSLHVIGQVNAGERTPLAVEPGQAIRIMTGSPLPVGANAVVPRELTRPDEEDRVAILREHGDGQNVRFKGGEMRTGDVLLRTGQALTPGAIGVAIACGAARVRVYRRPQVAILCSGDELVEPGTPLTGSLIRNSNAYILASGLRALGAEPHYLGILPDEMDVTRDALRNAAGQYDLVITSGAVSMGDRDSVIHVLADVGTIAFWKVLQRPGKPMAFAMTEAGTPLLCLPGNPASTTLGLELYARAIVRRFLGGEISLPSLVRVKLQSPVSNKGPRVHFANALATHTDGTFTARPLEYQLSSMMRSIAEGNGYLVIPEESDLAAGEEVDFLPFSWFRF